jgi:hypothetical protein
MELEITNTATVSALGYQILMYAIYTCIVSDGIKLAVKQIIGKSKEEKLNKWVTISLVLVIGILFGQLLQGPMVEGMWKKISFGFVISTTAFTSYDSVVSGLLKLIPKIMDRLFKK